MVAVFWAVLISPPGGNGMARVSTLTIGGSLLCGLILGLGPASAGSATDAAVAAQEVAEEHCAQAWTGKAVESAGALQQVARTLEVVGAAYEETEQPYLLYWRGVLFQCLGQYERAKDDLETFVESEKGSSTYVDQVQQAKLYLERAGRRVASAGAGLAASRVRRGPGVEGALSVGAGASLRNLACTDATTRLSSSHCLGGASERKPNTVQPQALHLAGAFEALIAAGAGIGVAGRLDLAVSDEAIDHPPLLAQGLVRVGPTFRFAGKQGRAVSVSIRPRFALGIAQVEPWAGLSTRAEDELSLDAGGWLGVHLGGSIAVDGEAEISNLALLTFGGVADVFAPAGGDLLIQQRDASADVVVPLPLEQARLINARGSVGVLLLPSQSARVALGPVLDVGLAARWVDVGTAEIVDWYVDVGQAHAMENARVHSTRRLDVSVILGLQIEVGGPASGSEP
jgi:hypothetical protein